ncbi:MAG TPA: PEP-CTERM sorting domain-containing protein [Myxococcota bacterium]|nr:PEP-CTERM sorting domain-containing protein [Myxococcota bacterium]
MSPSPYFPLRSFALALLAASAQLLSAAAAFGGTIGLTFDGPTDSTGKHWGVSASSASAAQAAGIGLLNAPISETTGNLDIVNQDIGSLRLTQSDLVTPFDVTSRWTAESEQNFANSVVWLVFTSIDPRTFEVNGQQKDVPYDPTKVGLRVDSSSGWVLLQTSAPSLGTIYYPAIRLGPLGSQDREVVNVPYFLQQLITFNSNGSTVLPLPKLRIAIALTAIPEPTTGLLLVAGLCGLAVRARVRS